MGTVRSVCTSERKGVQKRPVDHVDVKEDWGIEGDAHAGRWHRQVSLLGYESIEDFKARGAEVQDGDFGENLIVEGFDLKHLPLGTQFTCGDGVVLELTQIGKECHTHCAIYYAMGECIMPHEGTFCRVLHGGTIRPGDSIEMTHAPTEEEQAEVGAYAREQAAIYERQLAAAGVKPRA